MAITNRERVGKTMEPVRAGLAPFVEREFSNRNAPTQDPPMLPGGRCDG
jgi:hypothetical protein